MKTVISILVYDRYKNLEHWLECWEKCNKVELVELVVIHNTDTGRPNQAYFDLCTKHIVTYISRLNVGYDIGALQDVCSNALTGFPDYDNLLWCTDDVFPMALDFVQQFNNAMKPGVGVVAMEISPYVKPHIRTSAFMISKEVAASLKFPSDPVTTKRECYTFEHLGKKTFLEQVEEMGLNVIQVSRSADCPLWDSGYIRKLPRQKEHEAIFGPVPDQPPYIPKKAWL